MLFSESRVTEICIQLLCLYQNGHIRAGKRSHISQNPLSITFGLGRAQKIDALSQSLGSEADSVTSHALTHIGEELFLQE